jgi:multicomponent Na+:H+ antiporter subunit D
VLICALLAQVLTVAALGRALYRGFYRRREHPYDHFEPIRMGMKVSLGLLSVGCVAFGALAVPFVRHVAGPATAWLLYPAGYAAGALGAPVTLPGAAVTFDYFAPETLVIIAIEIIAGLALLVLALRGDVVSRRLGLLRRIHTGNINDYAALAAVGMIVVSCALML